MKQKLLMNHVKRIGCLSVLLLFVVQITYGQRSSVTGVVKDESGQTLPGVNVMIPGTTTGTVTDANGNYSIEAPSDGALQYSFIGYTSVTVKVEGRTSINVELKEDITSLQEVVVVGYGTQKKSDLTGSVATVNQKDLVQIATPDPVAALSGRVAGVNITSQSGEPGGGVKIRIRGITSINNSNPIYVVDGFQVNDISYLNPNDIESMDILKDASATAIYGSRGAAGVVIITTRKSKSGTPQVLVDGYVGLQVLSKKLDLLNASEYATLRMEAYENDGTPLATDGDLYTRLSFVRDGGYKGTDWQKEITQQALIQNYSATVMGGTEKHKFSVSGTYFDQKGIVKNTSMQKVFFRVNNDFNFTKWLDAGINLAYMHLDKTNYNNDLYGGVLPVAVRIDPVTPAWDVPTNNWGRSDISQNNNPARTTSELKYLKYFEHYFIANLYAQAKITKSLSFRTQLGASLKDSKNRNYYPQFFIATDEARDKSSLFEGRGESATWMWTNLLTFDKTFGNHTVKVIGGVESQLVNRYRGIGITGFGVPLNEDQRYITAAKFPDYTPSGGQSEETLQSYFARAEYSLKGKYLLSGTIRYDGSSKFKKDYRWGSFPSFSAGWIISDESFMKSVSQITLLKLRGGWGQVGNSNSVGPYRTVTTVSLNQLTNFNGEVVQGAAALSLSNPQIKWETSQMTNIGLDLGMFNNKLTFTAEYFERKTKDMIFTIPIPTYAGTGKPSANALSMNGSGIELTAGLKNREHALTYDISGNISFIKNSITNLAGGKPISSGEIGKVGATTRTEEGYEIAYIYGLRTDGVFNDQAELDAYVDADGALIQPNAKPGDVKFVDLDGSGTIDDKDRTYIGSATPDFTYGMSASIGYKNFDLRFLVTGSQGNEAVNALSRFNQSSNGLENSRKNRMNRWTAENSTSNEPRMTNADANKNIETFSDRYVEDASFLRMKNVQFGYNFPNAVINKWKLSNLRLYISVDNLFTVTKYTGFDPEFGDLYGNPLYYGVDQATYPNPRIFRAGINVKL
jgi:TonB-dependent starch-binding outer membrane protein SusC